MCGYCLAAEKLVAALAVSRFSLEEELDDELEIALAIDDASALAVEAPDDELVSDLRVGLVSRTFLA
jgi:hypothetical protein